MLDNKELHKKCETIKNDYSSKLKEETRKIENKYENEIYNLKKENNFLRKIINTLEKTVNKFSVSSEEEFIRDFQKENDIYLDLEKQIEYEKEIELDYEEM